MVELKEFDLVMKNHYVSPWVFLLIVGSSFGVWWLSSNLVDAGQKYFQLFTFWFVLMVFAILFLALRREGINFNLGFNEDNISAVVFCSLGILLFGAISLISRGFFSIAELSFTPLSSVNLLLFSDLTFSQISLSTSPGWVLFIIAFTAAVIEELTIGIFAYNVGRVIGDFVGDMFGLSLSGFWKNVWLHVAGNSFSVGVFMFIHLLSNDYHSLSQFLTAGGFRAVMNFFIHVVGFGVAFGIGAHYIVNFLVLLQPSYLGQSLVLQGLFTFQGAFFPLMLVLGWFLVIVNYHRWGDVFSDWWEGVRGRWST